MKLVLKKAFYPPLASLSVLITSAQLHAQDNETKETEDNVYILSPFTVESSSDVGYLATETLSGTRLRTSMKDIGSSIAVATEEFMKDVNAVDNESLMVYMAGAEVGGERSVSVPNYGGGSLVKNNFGSASSSTRVRGLANADNTLDYFLSDVNWDGYAIDRVDMQRGPNAILFGLGSPAGIINGSLRSAQFGEDKGHVELQYKSYDSKRLSGRYNKVILKDELAVMGAFLNEKRNYRQKPAYDNQDRFYGALRYEPRWLRTDSSSFRVDIKGETGQSHSNRPRWTPPTDKLSQFWAPLSEGGLNGQPLDLKAAWDTTSYYGTGIAQEKIRDWDYENNTTIGDEYENPNYTGSIVSLGSPSPLIVFADENSSLQNQVIMQPQIGSWQYWGMGSDGERDNSINGVANMNFSAFRDYNGYATEAGLIYSESGSYKERSITDPTIFDFYNKLIDGPNKREFSDFDTVTGTIRHTFLNNQIGYELSAFKQTQDGGSSSPLGWSSTISIDFNENLIDGTPNPNLGRPYVYSSSTYQENRYSNTREAYRASAFAEYDFRNLDNGSMSWLWKSLGRHIFNGAISKERHWNENYTFSRYAYPASFLDYQNPEAIDKGDTVSQEAWNGQIQTIRYLGGSLLDQTSAAGSHIPGLGAIQMPTSGTYRHFDVKWDAAGVDPAAVWISPKGEELTQSENPDNYVGWTDTDLPVIDTLEEGGYLERLMSGNRSMEKVSSQSLVWQGKFFDETVVAMYGWRKDKEKSVNTSAPKTLAENGKELGFRSYYAESFVLPELSEAESVEGQSNSYSIAVHVDKLKYMNWLPFQMSVFYNESENFQPIAGRTDIYNRAIPMPQGHTKDTSILLATKDNRLSLRVGKYECSVQNANADILGGTWEAAQFYETATNGAIKYQYNMDGNYYTIDHSMTDEEVQAILDENDGNPWSVSNANMVEYTDEEEAAILDAWWNLIRDTDPRLFQAFEMEKITQSLPENGNPSHQTWGVNSSLKYTQDVVSRGYEAELSALPLDNWRIRITVSKTEAVRSNVGGDALKDWVATVDEYMAGPAGDLPYWPSHARDKWNRFRLEYSLAELLDGQTQPDIRKWAFNIVNNYDFRDGWLKGTNIGCAYRWRDKSAIGYPYFYGEDGKLTRDAQNPYYGPTEKFVDAWIGYSWTMWDKYWNVRLNVQNIFADDELIPLNTQPDGSIATYRIPPDRTFQLSLNVDF